MTHQEVSDKLLDAMQGFADIEDASYESIIGGVAMTLFLMMDSMEIKSIEVGPHKVEISDV